jgi:amidohydrolase
LDREKLKTAVIGQIDAHQQHLRDLALKIHSDPEPGFHEVKASAWLTQYLEENGFFIERGICELPTAFQASYGKGAPNIAVIAEYDALPGVGHACGHNLICTIAVGAAVGARQVADLFSGTVSVIGTPAEELYGGKVIMANRGAFSNLDVAMMVHPGVADTATTYALACQNLNIEFFGQAAHAAARPERGINALEAMIQSFTAINSLRQHIKSTARIHGIITDGGQAPNVVPDHSAGTFIVRAMENDYLDELQQKVINCFSGAAQATGARLEYKWDDVRYAAMLNNMTLAKLFTQNMKRLGRKVKLLPSTSSFGSTDMGNVSQLVPAIHASVSIAPRSVLLHSPQFASAAASEAGINGMLDAAKALAMIIVDLLVDPDMLSRVKEEFKQKK